MKTLKFNSRAYFEEHVGAGLIKDFKPSWGENRSAISECQHKCTNGTWMKIKVEILGYYSSPNY